MADYRQMTRNVAARQWPQDRRAQDIFFRKIQAESGFNPNARSGAGALGIAQIVPKWHPGVDPLNPLAALRYSAQHDASNYSKYGNWRDVLSVYNSGRPWQEGQGISETRNYVQKILGGAAPSGAGPQGAAPHAPSTPPGGFPPATGQNPRAQFALSLIQAMNQPRDQQNMGLQQAIMGLRAAPSAPPASPRAQGAVPSQDTAGGAALGPGVRELFYDPLGAYDEGSWIKPIGGHSDHVHASFGNPETALAIIRHAQKLGLRVSENPYVDKVDPVHTKGSYHYRTFPATNIGQGLDASGDPAKMAALFNWIKANYAGRR